jgi:hypothetical protein
MSLGLFMATFLYVNTIVSTAYNDQSLPHGALFLRWYNGPVIRWNGRMPVISAAVNPPECGVRVQRRKAVLSHLAGANRRLPPTETQRSEPVS